MRNQYLVLKEKHQKEVNDFPMFFAFSNSQFKEGMAKFGLSESDTDKIYKLGGTGGFYLKTDAKKLHDMFDRHEKEMQQAIDDDKTGEGFIFQMFDYELANHEYSYTWSIESTLDALGLTYEEVKANEKLLHGLNKAKRNQS